MDIPIKLRKSVYGKDDRSNGPILQFPQQYFYCSTAQQIRDLELCDQSNNLISFLSLEPKRLLAHLIVPLPTIMNNQIARDYTSIGTEPPVAVSVSNGCMKFRNGQTVLRNFNMKVPVGTIYSLLGPSGCGKTTVLSSIVGIQSLTSGDVEVFGQRPGTAECGVPGPVLGYMPQGITLYRMLTIHETFLYFGCIYGMEESEVHEKVKNLTTFLNLPPSKSRISNLSGGQQRRVSLALCLLHEPRLLILDEPTVGVDPLLRERIWSYLRRIVSEQRTTVIITTHYVEETKDSNIIGIMRNGRLLIEESPRVLMEKHNSPFLEEVVTSLFKNANEIDQEEKIVCLPCITPPGSVEGIYFRQIDPDIHDCNGNVNVPLPDMICGSLTRPVQSQRVHLRSSKYLKTKALVVRNFLNFVRNPVLLYLVLFLPSFNAVIIHFIIGVPPTNLKLGIVNPEVNYSVAGCSHTSDGCKRMSCDYIDGLSSTIISPVLMESDEDALGSVMAGNTRGYLKFPQNYSSSLISRFVAGNFPDNESLHDSEIVFRLDHSDFLAAHYLKMSMLKTYLDFAIKAVGTCDSPEKSWIAKLPLNFRKPIYGKDDDSNTFLSSTVLLMITFFIPTITTCLTMITDRKNGTMDRTLVAGASKLDFLLAMTITEGGMILLQAIVSFIVGSLVMGWEIQGSSIAVVGLMFFTGIFGMSFSFLLAQFCKQEIEAILIAIGIFVSHLSITGLLWPLEGSSLVVRFFINLTPLNWAIDALRSVIIRGWPLSHPKVYPALIVLLVTTVLPVIIGIKMWRRT